MKIGILKENKQELRVSLTPIDVARITKNGSKVFLQQNAGLASGFSNKEYEAAGAKIFKSAKEMIIKSDIICKLSSPTNNEIKLCGKHKTMIFSIFNLSNNTDVLEKLLLNKVTSLGLEAVHESGQYSVVVPQEEVKGLYAVNLASLNLTKFNESATGVSVNPVTNCSDRAHFAFLNYSYATGEAVRTALALGADVTVFEHASEYRKELSNDEANKTLTAVFGNKFDVFPADFSVIEKILPTVNVLMTTTTVPGARASKRITEKMLLSMPKGSVFIDLSADQGFSSDTERTPKTFKNKNFTYAGVTHVTVSNIPSLYCRTVSIAMSHTIANLILKITKHDNLMDGISKIKCLAHAILTHKGSITSSQVGTDLNLKFSDFETFC